MSSGFYGSVGIVYTNPSERRDGVPDGRAICRSILTMPDVATPEVKPPLLTRLPVLGIVVAAVLALDGFTKAHAVALEQAHFNPRPASPMVVVLIAVMILGLVRPRNAVFALGVAVMLGGALGNIVWVHEFGVPDFIHVPPASSSILTPLVSLHLYPERGGVANVADFAIVIGMLVMLASFMFEGIHRHKKPSEEEELADRLAAFDAAQRAEAAAPPADAKIVSRKGL